MVLVLVGPCKWCFKSHTFSSSQHTNHNWSCRQVHALHQNTKLLITTTVKLITVNAKRKRQNLEREREREEGRVVVWFARKASLGNQQNYDDDDDDDEEVNGTCICTSIPTVQFSLQMGLADKLYIFLIYGYGHGYGIWFIGRLWFYMVI